MKKYKKKKKAHSTYYKERFFKLFAIKYFKTIYTIKNITKQYLLSRNISKTICY